VSGTDRAYQELGVDRMTTVTRLDNWFIKRIMKLTCFEKWLINSPRHARHTERTALALLEHISLPTDLTSHPLCL
jgi:hypothetical protein